MDDSIPASTTTIQSGRSGKPIRAKTVALKSLRGKILGISLDDLHANLSSLHQQHMEELHNCVDYWAECGEIVSPTASHATTPWGSRSPSPGPSRCQSASNRRRDQYPGIPRDTNQVGMPNEMPELLTPETKLHQFTTGYRESWAESRQAQSAAEFIKESNGFPPVPGAINHFEEQDPKMPAGPKKQAAKKERPQEDTDADTADAATEGKSQNGRIRKSYHQRGGIFVSVDELKETMKENLTKQDSAKASYYWETGWFQWIARHRYMEMGTLSVILLNALWMGYDADQNHAANLLDADLQFLIAENFFTVFFLYEWIVRFGAFEFKRNCFRDAWFVFDSMLVLLMITETWIFTLLFGSSPGLTKAFGALRWFRLLRLTRLARIARLLRSVPQLMIMVKAIVISLKTVSYAIVLLILMVYIFGVAFTIMLERSDERFDGVLVSMNTLLLAGALPDQVDLINELKAANIGFYFLMMMYLALASLTLMNMLIGIICEVIGAVSSLEKETMLLQDVKADLWDMLVEMNVVKDNDDRISKLEFNALLAAPKAARVLEDVGVDPIGLVDFADYIFSEDRPDLTFGDFMEIVLQLRGSNAASVKDIIDLRKIVLAQMRALEDVAMKVQTAKSIGGGNGSAFASEMLHMVSQ